MLVVDGEHGVSVFNPPGGLDWMKCMFYGKTPKLDSLSLAQRSHLAQVRETIYGYVVSTETNKSVAETGAATLVSVDFGSEYQVHWIPNPSEFNDFYSNYRSRGGTELINGFLWGSAQNSLSNVLSSKLSNEITIEFGSKFCIFDPDLHTTLGMNLSFSGIVTNILLSHVIARYLFCRDLPGVRYTTRALEVLEGAIQVLQGALALWAFPGHVILCEKPTRVDIENDLVVGMDFAD